jgi:hypothetical protein
MPLFQRRVESVHPLPSKAARLFEGASSPTPPADLGAEVLAAFDRGAKPAIPLARAESPILDLWGRVRGPVLAGSAAAVAVIAASGYLATSPRGVSDEPGWSATAMETRVPLGVPSAEGTATKFRFVDDRRASAMPAGELVAALSDSVEGP